MRNCQGVEVPWPLALAQKSTQQETKGQMMPGFGGELREDEAGTQMRRGTRDSRTPQGLIGTCVQVKGDKGGSAPSRETAGRCRHAARDTGTSNGEWRVADAGDVEVVGASHQERSWVAGEKR